MQGFISTIIPTLDDPLIGQVVLLAQQELASRGEIIVVGRDEARRVPRDGTVRFIDTGKPVGAATARNLGIQAAKGNYLFFLDADCLVQPGWADILIAHLSEGKKVVGGGVLSPTSNYWTLVYNISMFHEFLSESPPGLKRYLPTLNLAVHREVVERVGLMDESMQRGQDIDWTIRMALAGYQLYFEPRAAIVHFPRRTNMATVWRYGLLSGHFSARNRARYAAYYETPPLLQRPFWVRLLSPVVAAFVTVKMFTQNPCLLRYCHTAPAIYLTKIAWCLGVAAGS